MKNWKGVTFIVFALLTLLVCVASVFSAVPDTINFQGILADDNGDPVADGSYVMQFYLFDAATGGSQLWNAPDGEQQTVTVTNGVYNVRLGVNQPLDSTVFDDGAVWLEVVVEGEILSPRQHITAAPFALKAGDADTLTGNALIDLDGRYVQQGQTAAVDSNMITDGSVTSDDLGTDSVNASEIVAGAVRSSEVANNSLTADDLAIDSVTASEIASGAVGSSEIADGSVTSADLADGAALAEILDDDGPGSGLNADLLDGLSASAFMSATADNWVNVAGDNMTGALSVPYLQINGTTAFLTNETYRNTFVGLGTGQQGNRNTFVGNKAGSAIEDMGFANTFLGAEAGEDNTDGYHNTFVGSGAGSANMEGTYNTFLGSYAGMTTTSGVNTFIGSHAGNSNTEGHDNTFVGSHAGRSNNTGDNNTFVGCDAGYNNTTGNGNVFLGSDAGYNETASGKLYIDNSDTSEPLIWGDFSTDVAAVNGRLGVGIQPASAYQFHSLDERIGGRAVFGESTGDSAIGVWGNAAGDNSTGVWGRGRLAGGYFIDDNDSGLAYVGFGNRGIWAKGTMAGGTFSHPDDTTYWADVSTATRKIQGTGTVSFVQNHPYNDDTVIVYAAPEGDEVAVYTRGTARLVDGEARVTLGETFKYVSNPDIGLTVYLTSVGNWSDLYVAEKSTESILVRSAGGTANAAFDYLVYGLRLGFEEAAVLQPKQRDALLPTTAAIEAEYSDRPDLYAFNAMERYREMHAAVSPKAELDLSHSRQLVAALEDQRPGALARTAAWQEGMQANQEKTGDDSPHPSSAEPDDVSAAEAHAGDALSVRVLIAELRAEIDDLRSKIAAIEAGK